MESWSRPCLEERDQVNAVCQSTFRQLLLRAMSGKPALIVVVAGAWSRHEIALVEHAGSARLPDVIDYHLTTRHDQLEPPLRIGKDANILQWISLDDE
jgi:hypothetical protein